MKHFFILVFVFVSLASFKNYVGIDDVIAAMKAGNSGSVAKYFDNSVEISMPDKSNSYSKSQAELVLKDFFASNPLKALRLFIKVKMLVRNIVLVPCKQKAEHIELPFS